MRVATDLEAFLRAAWAPVAPRFAAYELLLPGAPSFQCLTSACPAHCCRIFSVALGEAEADRLAATHNLARPQFLECEAGEPIALPLAEPYLLKRLDGQCALLQPDLYCGVYEGRPNACRMYPHQLLVVDPATGRSATAESETVAAAVAALIDGDLAAPSLQARVPLLLRHLHCPGFEGPRLTHQAWGAQLAETCLLQFGSTPHTPAAVLL